MLDDSLLLVLVIARIVAEIMNSNPIRVIIFGLHVYNKDK